MSQQIRWYCPSAIASIAVLLSLSVAKADPVEVQLPLRDGRISTTSLIESFRAELPRSVLERLPLHFPAAEINVRGLGGSLFIAGMNSALGDGCRLDVQPNELILHVDLDKLPHSMDELKTSVRTFTKVAEPSAAAAQAKRWGLMLPANLDPAKPLVLLVHGLDSDERDWTSFDGLLDSAGLQSARFDYPADGPIRDDIDLLTQNLGALHDRYPGMQIKIVAYSMGSLVSRGYVEGPNYAGGVSRLIMIAPPNHGSSWAPLEPLAKAAFEWNLANVDACWSPPWIIISGLDEAARDLEPGSTFLTELNARPRRAGVRYTIIEGNANPIQCFEAHWLATSMTLLPTDITSNPLLWLMKVRLLSEADALRDRPTISDGLVTLSSAQLAGVTDVVTVHADHTSLCLAHGNQPPAAWNAVRDRLTQ